MLHLQQGAEGTNGGVKVDFTHLPGHSGTGTVNVGDKAPLDARCAVLSKTPDGHGSIPELDLKATQSGKHHGLLGADPVVDTASPGRRPPSRPLRVGRGAALSCHTAGVRGVASGV